MKLDNDDSTPKDEFLVSGLSERNFIGIRSDPTHLWYNGYRFDKDGSNLNYKSQYMKFYWRCSCRRKNR